MSKVEFGVRLPHSGPLGGVENIDRIIDEAETLGFDSVWTHNHIQWTDEMHRHHISSGAWEALRDDQDPSFYESITTLAYAAGKSSKLKVGVAALVMASYDPVIMGKQLANIDNLSRGKLQVVVGLGAAVTTGRSREFEILGIPAKRRKDVMEEKAMAMKEVWTKPKASFHGKYVNFDDAVIYPKPIQKPYPPLIYGGWTKYGLDRAARLFDGWFAGYRSPPQAKEAVAELYEKAKNYGRSDKKFLIGVEKKMHIKKTREEALSGVSKTIAGNRGYVERELPFDDIIGEALIGSEEDVFKQVEGFTDAGVTLFEMKPIYRSIDELADMMKTFSRVIFPSFK